MYYTVITYCGNRLESRPSAIGHVSGEWGWYIGQGEGGEFTVHSGQFTEGRRRDGAVEVQVDEGRRASRRSIQRVKSAARAGNSAKISTAGTE
jgi:hypothetical protein